MNTLASKEQVKSFQNEISDIIRFQSHLQRKQDQLASKQDLLHSTIASEQQTSVSVMSSPMLSPPTPCWNQPTHNSPFSIPRRTCMSERSSSFLLRDTVREQQQNSIIVPDEELSSILDEIGSIDVSISSSDAPGSSSVAAPGQESGVPANPDVSCGFDSGVSLETTSLVCGQATPDFK